MKTHYDILIIGAGPAGSVSAYQLAKAGFDVLILDAKKVHTRKICGEFLCHEGVAILKVMGLEEVATQNNFLPGMGAKIVTHGGVVVSGFFPQPHQKQVGGYCLDRKAFDTVLVSKAEEQGAQFLFGERVIDIQPLHHGWKINTFSGKTFTTDLLIGADGIRSMTAHLLGLTVPNKKKRFALRCFLPTRVPNQRLIEMHLLTHGNYIGVDVVGSDFVNFSIVANQEELKQHGNLENLVRYYYQSLPKLRQNMILPEKMPDIEAISPVTHKVKSCIHKNAVLIGDAGGFIEPLTGEGITIALWTASALTKELIQSKANWQNRQAALQKYQRLKYWHFLEKKTFTVLLHWFIRQDKACDIVCNLLKNRMKSVEAFMGIINNTYGPIEGTFRLLAGIPFSPGKHVPHTPA